MFESFSLYKPRFDFSTSDEYKERLSIIREQQKLMIKKKLPLLDWLIKKSSYVVVWRGSV